MSDPTSTGNVEDTVASQLQLTSDSDDSNSAGSNGYFQFPPRPLRGRAARNLARRVAEEGNNKENDPESTVSIAAPSSPQSPRRNASARRSQGQQNTGLWEINTPPRSSSAPAVPRSRDESAARTSGRRESSASSSSVRGDVKKRGLKQAIEKRTKQARYEEERANFDLNPDLSSAEGECEDGNKDKGEEGAGCADEEDRGPPPLEAQECNLYGYEPSDSEDDVSAAPTLDYSLDKVRYNIGIEGIFTMDAPARTGNGLAAAIGNILDSRVTNSCGCHMEDSRPSDPANLTKKFESKDKSVNLACSLPNMCNKIDITAANYVAEREMSAKEILRLRNRSISLCKEEHYYMSRKICRYEDMLEVGSEILLYAVILMEENKHEIRLVKKDSVKIYFVR